MDHGKESRQITYASDATTYSGDGLKRSDTVSTGSGKEMPKTGQSKNYEDIKTSMDKFMANVRK